MTDRAHRWFEVARDVLYADAADLARAVEDGQPDRAAENVGRLSRAAFGYGGEMGEAVRRVVLEVMAAHGLPLAALELWGPTE